MIPEKECPQAEQTNVYVSNPQLSITGSSDLRNGTSAVGALCYRRDAEQQVRNFFHGKWLEPWRVQPVLRGRMPPEVARYADGGHTQRQGNQPQLCRIGCKPVPGDVLFIAAGIGLGDAAAKYRQLAGARRVAT